MNQSWRKMSPRARKEAVEGFIGLSPWLVGFLLFTLGPILASIFFSMTEWTITSPPEWVGFANYKRMFFDDPLFWQALKVTLLYVAYSLPIKLVFGLALALLLNVKVPGMNFFRTIFYIPAVISGVAVSMMWLWLLQPDYGAINSLLSLVGIQGPGWFWDPDWALFSVALMSVWTVGSGAVIYLAGLQNIPPHLYEAAEMDGAGPVSRFFNITLPLLTPTLFFQLIIEMIESFRVFTQAFIITRGGPLNATYFYMLYLYEEAFQNFNMGYASAMAIVLTLIILSATVLIYRTSNRWVYYETDVERAQ